MSVFLTHYIKTKCECDARYARNGWPYHKSKQMLCNEIAPCLKHIPYGIIKCNNIRLYTISWSTEMIIISKRVLCASVYYVRVGVDWGTSQRFSLVQCTCSVCLLKKQTYLNPQIFCILCIYLVHWRGYSCRPCSMPLVIMISGFTLIKKRYTVDHLCLK